MARCGVTNMKTLVWDALETDPSAMAKADIVIADLPCSGLGIIGRKPDIKYNMTSEKLEELAGLQREILSVVWQYVKPGGLLCYSTCTIDRLENQDNAAWLRERFPLVPVDLTDRFGGLPQEPSLKDGWIQFLPGCIPMTGFSSAYSDVRRVKQARRDLERVLEGVFMLDLLDCNGKKDIKSMTLEEVTAQMAALGEKSFRAKQLYDWMHVKLAEGFDDMSSLSIPLRQKLKENYSLTCLKMVDERVSQVDGTRKYLFGLEDGHVIESVWMQYHHGNSVCISSQVGCRMGCRFCASTLDGLERNLRPSEMLEQIYRIQSITGERVSNVVVMGSGEPMDNYDNVIRFLRLVSHEKGLNISQRSLTISTCGIVPGIRKFAEEGLAVTLALSLHAPNDEVRKTPYACSQQL